MKFQLVYLHPSLKNTILILIAILVAAGGASYMYEYSQKTHASNAWSVTPLFGPTAVDFKNDRDYVDVVIQTTIGEKMSYGKIILQYPQRIMSFKNADTTSCMGMATGSTHSSSVVESGDKITIIRDTFVSDEELPDGAICFVRLHFFPISFGEGELKFVDLESWDIQGPLGPAGVELESNGVKKVTITNGTPLISQTPSPSVKPTAKPTSPPSVTISISPTRPISSPSTSELSGNPTGIHGGTIPLAKINYRIKLQGVTSLPKSTGSINMKISLQQESNTIDSRTIAFSPTEDGTWIAVVEYHNIPQANNFFVSIKGPKHLKMKVCENTPNERIDGTYQCNTGKINITAGENMLDFSNIFMLAGDLPIQNGIVDSVDIAFVRSSIGSKNTEAVARGDVNYDGIIESQDYTILINALSYKYDR